MIQACQRHLRVPSAADDVSTPGATAADRLEVSPRPVGVSTWGLRLTHVLGPLRSPRLGAGGEHHRQDQQRQHDRCGAEVFERAAAGGRTGLRGPPARVLSVPRRLPCVRVTARPRATSGCAGSSRPGCEATARLRCAAGRTCQRARPCDRGASPERRAPSQDPAFGVVDGFVDAVGPLVSALRANPLGAAALVRGRRHRCAKRRRGGGRRYRRHARCRPLTGHATTLRWGPHRAADEAQLRGGPTTTREGR